MRYQCELNANIWLILGYKQDKVIEIAYAVNYNLHIYHTTKTRFRNEPEVKIMEHMSPKNKNDIKIEVPISKRAYAILTYFAKYSGHDTGDIISHHMEVILENQEFVEWIKKQRYHKRIMSELNLLSDEEESPGEQEDANDEVPTESSQD